MKENELMIGDWVLVNGTPMQIQAINDIDGEIMAGDELYCLIEDRVHSEDKIEPIPLTAEILEKNGFKKHNRYQYIYKDNYCKVCVSFAPRIEIDGMDLGEPPINISIEGALFDININMSAIHELQHALKLCGIDKEIVL